MFEKKRIMFIVMVIGILTVQLLFPAQARADEGTPTGQFTDGSGLEATATPENPPAETITPESSPTPTITPLPTEVPQEALLSPAEQILSQVPDGTNVVVINDAGQMEAFASQDAAQIITESDPMWCPGSPPIPPNQTGCVKELTITALIPLITNPQAGTIYFMADYYDADFGALSAASALKDYPLTIQGGWAGGTSTVLGGLSAFWGVPVTVTGWNNNVTINDIYIFMADLTVASASGNIDLNNVIQVGNVQGAGGSLSTDTGNIQVDNSSFSDNGDDGLSTTTSNDVILGATAFVGNGKNGLTIDATSVDINGNCGSVYIPSLSGWQYICGLLSTNNAADGVKITASGDINLNGVTAGAFICDYCGAADSPDTNNGNGVAITQTGTGAINIYGGNFSNNKGDGLNIVHGDGPLTLANLPRFNANGGNGLYSTGSGAVVMDVFDAIGNGNDGVHVANSGSIYSYNGWMWNNGGNGATLISQGNIYVNGQAEFISNAKFGVQFNLNNPATFFLDCVIFDGNGSGNYGQIKPAPLGSKFLFAPCGGTATEISLNFVPIPSGVNNTEFVLDCTSTMSFVVRLPNDDRITILCPVSGNAQIRRLTNTMLPADLPEGYSYLSAFSVDITREKKKLDVINDGGFIRYSFAKPLVTGESQFAILYWDEASHQWFTLPAYSSYIKQDTTYPSLFSISLDPASGNIDPFRLAALGKRVIIGGTSVLPGNGRVEASTNFPGIFVLVQK